MANLKLIHVDERPVKINSLRDLSEEDKAALQIRMQLILQYRDESDTVGLQMDIAYVVSESDMILHYQALCVVENDEWPSFIAGKPDEDTIKAYSGEMFDMVLGFARSSIAKKYGRHSIVRTLPACIQQGAIYQDYQCCEGGLRQEGLIRHNNPQQRIPKHTLLI